MRRIIEGNAHRVDGVAVVSFTAYDDVYLIISSNTPLQYAMQSNIWVGYSYTGIGMCILLVVVCQEPNGWANLK